MSTNNNRSGHHHTEQPVQSTSPWTEAYDMYCHWDGAWADETTSPVDFASDEQKPTRDALADTYNRDYPDMSGKRV